jgi:Icc-related predicted phosphoesterase
LVKSTEKRLFILTNSTHYLNVKNYIESHNEAENFVVLAVRPYEGFKDLRFQIEADPSLHLLQVIFVGEERSNKFFEYWDILSRIYQVKRLKRVLPNLDKVLFTNYNSWLHHYITNQYSLAQPVLISDGTAIFSVAEQRKITKEIPFAGSIFFTKKILNLKPIEHLHFYTQVKLNLADSDTQEVFRFKASEKVNINENKVFFVGSPLVEAGYLDVEKNISHLKKVKEQFKGKQIFYFAHRREEVENLNRYNFFGEIIKDAIPFEDRMQKEEELPKHVVSFVSSVLINLPQVLPQVDFYYLELNREDIIHEEYKKRYLDLKNVFQDNCTANFRVLK